MFEVAQTSRCALAEAGVWRLSFFLMVNLKVNLLRCIDTFYPEMHNKNIIFIII